MAKDHTVQAGDCVSSLAFENGLPWETLWNHSNNAELKLKRKNPNILKRGDILHVPDLRPGEQPRATEKKHKFKLKGAPVELRLRIMEIPRLNPTRGPSERNTSQQDRERASGPVQPARDPQEEPRSNLPYTLLIDGKIFDGKTGIEGMIECEIPPNARQGKLILEPGTPGEFTIDLRIGCLDPVEEIAGAQARLNNLGFKCGAVDDILGPRTKAALRDFQVSRGLEASGELDKATINELRAAHDAN